MSNGLDKDLVDRFERLKTLGLNDEPLPTDDELARRLEKLSESSPAPAATITTKEASVPTPQKQDFGKILDSDPNLLSELSELYEDSSLLSDLDGLGYEVDLNISTAGVPSKAALGDDETPEQVKAVARLLRSEQKPVIVDFIELENATSPSKPTRRRSAGGPAHDVKATPRSTDELARFRTLVEKTQPGFDAASAAAAADPELAKILSQLPTTPTHPPPGFSTSSTPTTTPSRNVAAVVSSGDSAISALVSQLSDQINLERKHAAVDAAVEQRWRERLNELKELLPAVSSSSSTQIAPEQSRSDELGAPPPPPSFADFEIDGKGKAKKWKGKGVGRQRKKADSSSESSTEEDSDETSSSSSDESD
ncbi:hypothetical protein BJ742DRAFT_775000 [Cladochytrium replicatum]|nr:hypothetical protein BJ742DRAFT_775000 [Cladochytrium replicatum]